MATAQEIKELKTGWLADDCWDIEDTPGFEKHYDELLAFRLAVEKEAERVIYNKVDGFAKRCGISHELAEYILGLELRLETMQNMLYERQL